MAEVLAKSLTTKSVVGVDGIEFGTVHNITLSPKSGTLHDLVVTPAEKIKNRSTDFETNGEGRLLIPINRIKVVKDTIIVQ